MSSRARTTIAIAVAVAIAGCGSKTERKGEVVALEGSATAQRGDGEPRPLAVGDVVLGDDRVRVADDSELKIHLAHNGVTLIFDAGADAVLASTAGWKASGEVGASVLDKDPVDKTSAAGVHSEHEAAKDPRAALENETKQVSETPPDDVNMPDTGSGVHEPDTGSDHYKPPRGGNKGGGSDGALGNKPTKPRLALQVVKADRGLAGVARTVIAKLAGELRKCGGKKIRLTLRFDGGTISVKTATGIDAACARSAFGRVKVPAKLAGVATVAVEL